MPRVTKCGFGYIYLYACEIYFNTLCDSFYMGYKPWNEFKILVDILIQLNTTRTLRTNVRKEMKQLHNIRHLIVDLNIFGAVPAASLGRIYKA